MAKIKISGFTFYKFGGKKFLLEDYVERGGVIVYEMPELDLVAKGLTYKEAADALSWEIEVRLRDTKMYTEDVWRELRRVNGYSED